MKQPAMPTEAANWARGQLTRAERARVTAQVAQTDNTLDRC